MVLIDDQQLVEELPPQGPVPLENRISPGDLQVFRALAELVSGDFEDCLEFSGRVSRDDGWSWLVMPLRGVVLRRAGR